MVNKIINFFRLLKQRPDETFNIKAYKKESIVGFYKNQKPYLHPAEQSLLDLLEDKLSNFEMLDIGVGAGRTTHFFSHRVRKYIGVDYSQGMIDSCRHVYSNLTFEIQDVRNLKYDDKTFDFILFSYNGLDSISYQDRKKALSEIRRVLKGNGYFAFSTHNLNAAHSAFRFPLSINLKKWYKAIVLRKANPLYKSLLKKDHTMIFDGTHGYEISNYYCTPKYQISELSKHNFSIVKIFKANGNEVSEIDSYSQNDLWLHYLCRKEESHGGH